MIDVIIPIYNAENTLENTLMSLDLQTISNELNIYLIDDCSNCDYQEIISKYSNLNIVYHRLEKNVGPGLARQKGLDISTGKYIIFIDADDLLYNVDSIKTLYGNIKFGYDYVMGITYDEKKESFIFNEGDLHGKIYSRKFLEDNNIRFNNSRFHEDNYFNNLVLVCDPKKKEINRCVYIYRYNKNSITNDDKDFDRLEILISNMRELIDEANNRNCKRDIVIFLLAIKVRYFTRLYLNWDDEKKKKFESWLKKYNINVIKYIDIENYDNIYKNMFDTYEF